VQSLEDLVRASIETWDGRLEIALLGTDDPAAVAGQLERLVTAAIGAPTHALLYRTGVGIVAGLAFAEGTAAVVKVHRWNVSNERLAAVQRVQAHLAANGLSAPKPLAGPFQVGEGIATIEEYLPGGATDGRSPAVRASLAFELFRFVDATRALSDIHVGPPALLRPPGAPLWPEPHSIRFDFDATAAGAEWIDDAARDARQRLEAGRDAFTVVGHFDWRVENLGFDGDHIVAIYDWDSVAAAPEPVIVGVNAAQFCTDWTDSSVDPLPSVPDMIAFVRDYERARGRPFDAADRELLDAANLSLIAYGARCQHSDSRLQPDLARPESTCWPRLLRQRGAHLFDGFPDAID
jgi:hypothetical protein